MRVIGRLHKRWLLTVASSGSMPTRATLMVRASEQRKRPLVKRSLALQLNKVCLFMLCVAVVSVHFTRAQRCAV